MSKRQEKSRKKKKKPEILSSGWKCSQTHQQPLATFLKNTWDFFEQIFQCQFRTRTHTIFAAMPELPVSINKHRFRVYTTLWTLCIYWCIAFAIDALLLLPTHFSWYISACLRSTIVFLAASVSIQFAECFFRALVTIKSQHLEKKTRNEHLEQDLSIGKSKKFLLHVLPHKYFLLFTCWFFYGVFSAQESFLHVRLDQGW